MAQTYFAGKKGSVTVEGYSEILRATSWNYVADKSLLDITNSLSNGTEQYIPTLTAGNITLQGMVTKEFIVEQIETENLYQGQEVLVSLYFDGTNSIGFEDINAIIDEFTWEMNLDGAATYQMTLLRNEPKI